MTKAPVAAVMTALTAFIGSIHAQPGLGDASLDELRNARDLLIQVADYAGALPPATAVVEMLERTSDPQLGLEVLRLAQVQAGLGDTDSAEESYLLAIELITDADGANSPALVDAHQGLGRMYLNSRRFDEALVALNEGRALSRRIEGLFNVEGQSSLIDDLTLAHLGNGEMTDALDLQQERLDSAIRRYDADDPRVIPYHAHLGDYLDNSRLRTSARRQYARALQISEASFGSTSAESLSLLRRLAEIDLLLDEDNGVVPRIIAALEQLPDLNPVIRAGVLATLGDWALVYEGPEPAAARYSEAWRLLDAVDSVDPGDFFRNPRPLNLIPPLSRVDRATRRDPWAWGVLTLEFDVGADGRASHVETIEMTPESEDLAADYRRRIREAYFRPRMADGVPVSTADVRYRQNFRFYVRD